MQDPSPPESLLNFEPPLFVGGNSKDSTKPVPESSGAVSQVDEIINSMLPPRCVLAHPLPYAAATAAAAAGATAATAPFAAAAQGAAASLVCCGYICVPCGAAQVLWC